MKKIISSILFFLIFVTNGFSQINFLEESKLDKDKRMSWWRNSTFGLFIHWGAYAVPAGIYKEKSVTEGNALGEWIMENAKIPIAEYEQFVKQFNPVKFNAKEWVDLARKSGLKYIVITTKHHDGFCLWDSKVTDYDIMDFSPFKRDILNELATACKEANIKLGFYYSLLDWHQPDAKSVNYNHQNTANPDFNKYREAYLKSQLAELIKNYDPEIIWFDGEWIPEWTEEQGRDLYNYLRNLKPSLIINNRVGKGRNSMQGMSKYKDAVGDFGTPEQEILNETSESDWESCMTMNDTWGFKKYDSNWKSSELLIHNLIDIVAKGGNYLLNVGPDAQGLIPEQSQFRLKEMGKWLKVNGEAVYNTTNIKKYQQGDSLKFTAEEIGKFIYALITKKTTTVTLKNFSPVKYSKIYMLGVKKELKFKKDGDDIIVMLPQRLPCNYAWAIKLQVK